MFITGKRRSTSFSMLLYGNSCRQFDRVSFGLIAFQRTFHSPQKITTSQKHSRTIFLQVFHFSITIAFFISQPTNNTKCSSSRLLFAVVAATFTFIFGLSLCYYRTGLVPTWRTAEKGSVDSVQTPKREYRVGSGETLA